MTRHILPALVALIALAGMRAPDPVTTTRVDPLAVPHADFARHRDAATWDGWRVERLDFTEERARWRLYRITDFARPAGPLWFVPHDDENAAFEAALVALRRFGGAIVLVDGGGGRFNTRVAFGRPIDPNRHFHDGLPRYLNAVLASLRHGASPIIALHTNAAGYDGRRSTCPREGQADGRGTVSIRYCSAVLDPSPSRARGYPFDSDDDVAFAAWRATGRPSDAYCHDALVGDDWNVVRERVANTDGSLSNYAVLTGRDYLNFETLETGLEPAALAAARDRLVWMIDRALAICPRAERR